MYAWVLCYCVWLVRDSRLECARSHEFSDQNNALPAFGRSLPGVVKADNVGML